VTWRETKINKPCSERVKMQRSDQCLAEINSANNQSRVSYGQASSRKQCCSSSPRTSRSTILPSIPDHLTIYVNLCCTPMCTIFRPRVGAGGVVLSLVGEWKDARGPSSAQTG